MRILTLPRLGAGCYRCVDVVESRAVRLVKDGGPNLTYEFADEEYDVCALILAASLEHSTESHDGYYLSRGIKP